MAFVSQQTIITNTTKTAIYLPTGGTIGTVIGLTICPTNGVDAVVDIQLGLAHIVKSLTVTNGTTAVPVGGEQKLVVPDGVTMYCTSTQNVDIIVSSLES